jgi:hypothetical protein
VSVCLVLHCCWVILDRAWCVHVEKRKEGRTRVPWSSTSVLYVYTNVVRRRQRNESLWHNIVNTHSHTL